MSRVFFFFNDTATTENYTYYNTLSLHDALPISLPTTGKIIAELKFAFWENIFTVGQDSRIWNAHFRTCFPGAPQGQPTPQCRATAYADLQIIRRLRTRIAHHEPIFMRNIPDDHQPIHAMIAGSNQETGRA